MTRFEQDYYNDVSSIEKSLKRIADALEKGNNKHLGTGCSLDPNNLKHQEVDGKVWNSEIDEWVDKDVNETLKAEEQEELDTHHDYLHQLVQDLDNNAYQEFCNTHCLRMNDAVEVSNYITDLDYSEVLGLIKEIEEKSDDQTNEDAIELKHGHFSEKIGVTYDDDYDLRVTAKMYNDELQHGHLSTKKECILDYITNEFGSQGARYTDIIKFAYYLNHPNGPKFGYNVRGYYSQGLSGRRPYLVCGGKDFLVKGINKEGNERYFALSHVESVTEYWKYAGGTHGYM